MNHQQLAVLQQVEGLKTSIHTEPDPLDLLGPFHLKAVTAVAVANPNRIEIAIEKGDDVGRLGH